MTIKNKIKNFKKLSQTFKKKWQNKRQIIKIQWKNNFCGLKQVTDFTLKLLIYFFTILTLLILLILVGFIIYKSIYFFQNYDKGFWGFLTGQTWNANNDQFGIWKIIISTFFVLLISLSFAIPLTIFSSLFICEYLSIRWKKRIINIVQLLAGIPSVVFGLFSLSILGPLFMLIGAPSTSNLLITSITLAFMGLPIMISLSINAIDSVPDSYRFSSLALGLSKTNTTYQIVLKSASIKIAAAIMLGIARIIGETMAVMMISGNVSDGLKFNNGFLNFIFASISTLSSTIGLEMLENSGPLHESALYAIGLILFIIVFFINIFVLWVQSFKKRHLKTHNRNKKLIIKKYNPKTINRIFYTQMEKTKKLKKITDGVGLFFLISSTIIVVSFTLIIITTILWKGLLNMRWADFISTSTYNEGAGILSTLLVTLLLVFCSIIFAIILSIIVAIYLNEYANPNSFFTKTIRFSIDLLASTPSIIYGTFGLAFFIGVLQMPLSILPAGLTLTIVILPIMIRSIEDSLSNVSDSLRQASLALGASKTATIIKIVVPNAFPGIITAIILAIGRIIGESAPIYLTLGTAVRLPIAGFLSPGASMTTEILMLSKEGSTSQAIKIMYELAFIIMFLILLVNALARVFSKQIVLDYIKITFKQKWKNRIKLIKKFNYQEYYKNKINKLKYSFAKIKTKKRRNKIKKQNIKNEKDK